MVRFSKTDPMQVMILVRSLELVSTTSKRTRITSKGMKCRGSCTSCITPQSTLEPIGPLEPWWAMRLRQSIAIWSKHVIASLSRAQSNLDSRALGKKDSKSYHLYHLFCIQWIVCSMVMYDAVCTCSNSTQSNKFASLKDQTQHIQHCSGCCSHTVIRYRFLEDELPASWNATKEETLDFIRAKGSSRWSFFAAKKRASCYKGGRCWNHVETGIFQFFKAV